MTEEFSLLWRFRHWLALKIGGVHIAHQEKVLNDTIEGWRKTNVALEVSLEQHKLTVEGLRRDRDRLEQRVEIAEVVIERRNAKIKRQAEQITRLETSRASLREALAAEDEA